MNETKQTFESKITWLLVIITAALAGMAGIEARIDASVSVEAERRERQDAAIKQEMDENMKEIRQELRELNAYLRDRNADTK